MSIRNGSPQEKRSLPKCIREGVTIDKGKIGKVKGKKSLRSDKKCLEVAGPSRAPAEHREWPWEVSKVQKRSQNMGKSKKTRKIIVA